jgi:hypothetical protein
MDISVMFENPHTYWAPQHIFKNFFDWFLLEYSNHNIFYENSNPLKRGNPSSPDSPHVMVIKNVENDKYIIVSYWDRAIELTWDYNGWDDKNKVDIITSSGVFQEMSFTPFSYCCYSSNWEKIANNERKKFEDKTNNNLLFRGYFYGNRLSMKNYKSEYFAEKIQDLQVYFDEINNSMISLSLDGAAEICNRDMEILCCGSVLLRSQLNQQFHNNLIPDFHYISVDKIPNPKEQLDLLIDKYESVKNDKEYLKYISENGLKWFLENGTIDANVDILKKIVNIDKLI